MNIIYWKGIDNMSIYETISNRRTIRRFEQKPVQHYDLVKLVDCARLAPFGANLQPLKYKIITEPETVKALYPLTKWAAYLDWEPNENERPTAYIAIINDTSIKPTANTECDCGAAVMSMILEACELGLGTCWLGAIDRVEIKKLLNLDENLDIKYLLAVGYPAQSGDICDINNGDIKYFFDEDGNVCVPKRRLSEIIIR